MRARERTPLDEVGGAGTRGASAALMVADDTPLLETRTTPPSCNASTVRRPPQGNATALASLPGALTAAKVAIVPVQLRDKVIG